MCRITVILNLIFFKLGFSFFATNSPFWDIADSEHLSKATVFRCVNAVVKPVNSRLNHINWPETEVEWRRNSIDFFNKLIRGNLPGSYT